MPQSLNLPKVVYVFKEMESRISGGDIESEPSICSPGILMVPFLQHGFESLALLRRGQLSTPLFSGTTPLLEVFGSRPAVPRSFTGGSLRGAGLALSITSSLVRIPKAVLREPREVSRWLQGGGTREKSGPSEGECVFVQWLRQGSPMTCGTRGMYSSQ